MGCNRSKKDSGIIDTGRWAFIKALQHFNELDTDRLNPRSFAAKLREFLRPACRLTYSVKSIADELDRVARWFSSGRTYYDAAGNVCSISGPIVNPSSTVTRRHMSGDVNPKTCAEFTADERRKIEATQPHNLLHNSAA